MVSITRAPSERYLKVWIVVLFKKDLMTLATLISLALIFVHIL